MIIAYGNRLSGGWSGSNSQTATTITFTPTGNTQEFTLSSGVDNYDFLYFRNGTSFTVCVPVAVFKTGIWNRISNTYNFHYINNTTAYLSPSVGLTIYGVK